MIPGHNLRRLHERALQRLPRRPRRRRPFFGEGWPLYWELTLYDKGFHKTPEQKVGALFWRMHRCARIIFSLKFHMGQWSPQEVHRLPGGPRRSRARQRHGGSAPLVRSGGRLRPLYQAAYLLGGLQLRGLRKELVDAKQMTNKRSTTRSCARAACRLRCCASPSTSRSAHARHEHRLEVLRRTAPGTDKVAALRGATISQAGLNRFPRPCQA